MKKEDLEKMVKKGKLKKLHTSYIREYISRKIDGYVSKYKGKFGEGYVFDAPNWDSTRYSFRTYYVK